MVSWLVCLTKKMQIVIKKIDNNILMMGLLRTWGTAYYNEAETS